MSGELRINARSPKEKALYCSQIGLYLFGNDALFPSKPKYTLEPLREDGEAALVCADIEGMESVTLTEIWFYWGGAEKEIEIRRAADILSAYSMSSRHFPLRPRIIRAKLKVKFDGCKTPRTVVVRPPNVAQFTRDHDSALLETWLIRRGFIMNRFAKP
jgi:hypothetical protein